MIKAYLVLTTVDWVSVVHRVTLSNSGIRSFSYFMSTTVDRLYRLSVDWMIVARKIGDCDNSKIDVSHGK